MGWFEEQLRKRTQAEESALNDVITEMAGIIVGSRLLANFKASRIIARNAIESILAFYHIEMTELPEDLDELDDILGYLSRTHNFMCRNVLLTKGWHVNAFGAMLGTLKETGELISILPDSFGGYYYLNAQTGKKTRITGRNEMDIDAEAICFYMGLPTKKLDIRELCNYMLGNLKTREWIRLGVFVLAGLLLGLLVAPLTQLLYAEVLESDGLKAMLSLLLFFLTVKLSQSIMDMLKQVSIQRISAKQEVTVQAAVMMRVLMLPTTFFRKYSPGELGSRLDLIPDFCSKMLTLFLLGGYTIVVSLIYVIQMFAYSSGMAIVVFFQIAVTVIAGYHAIKSISKNKKKILEAKAKENGQLYASLQGVSKIRLSGTENLTFLRWANLYIKSIRASFKPSFWVKVCPKVPIVISLIAMGMLYYLAFVGNTESSVYFGFMACYGVVTAMLAELTAQIDGIAGIGPIYEMLRPFLEMEPENTENQQLSEVKLSGAIKMTDVTFSYENGPTVLNHLNLNIEAGQYVAIVGKTGCGKSTLVRLLLGFEHPQGGKIYYDERPMNQINPQDIRQQIGTVLQDGKLFVGDIYSNIVICNPMLTMADAWKAAEMAGIADDIRKMPMGMRTLISEENGGISGGQKQRLMIARAIANRPRILFFDEATSALDNLSQKLVSDSLDSLKCTRIVIAHRLSTIRNCDRILVLDEGQVKADGKYDELLETSPLFVELVKRQTL